MQCELCIHLHYCFIKIKKTLRGIIFRQINKCFYVIKTSRYGPRTKCSDFFEFYDKLKFLCCNLNLTSVTFSHRYYRHLYLSTITNQKGKAGTQSILLQMRLLFKTKPAGKYPLIQTKI